MAFARPTLPDLVARIQLDFVSRLSLVGAVLRRSLVYVLARVLAGAAHMMHGHIEFLGRQLFPDQAEAEFLVRHASIFGVVRNPPSYAAADVTFTGDEGEAVPAGTVLVSAAGNEYTTDADATIGVGGSVVGSVTASAPGAASSLQTGVVLSLASPITGVDASGVVSSPSDGDDEESIESLRARLLERLSDPPHGGTVADYVAWAKEVPGVTRVWVTPFELGPGTVVVRFARDNDGSPIPDVGEVAAVQAKLDAEAPAHAQPTAAAPVAAPVAFTLAIVPDNTAMRNAVAASLSDFFLRREPGETVLLSGVRTAIGATAGLSDYTLTTPNTNVTHTANQLPTLGTITWA